MKHSCTDEALTALGIIRLDMSEQTELSCIELHYASSPCTIVTHCNVHDIVAHCTVHYTVVPCTVHDTRTLYCT